VLQETNALLTEKFNEALELSARKVKLHAKVEKLKEELAKRGEELARSGEELAQKDELLKKTNEDMTNNVLDSYTVEFDDVVT